MPSDLIQRQVTYWRKFCTGRQLIEHFRRV